MFDKLGEECGVFGIYGKKNSNVAVKAYFALYALQHRGQESCGIAVNDDGVIHYHRDLGLVPEVFTKEVLESLGKGNMALGHVRHAVNEKKSRSNAQPIVVRHVKGNMAIAHNGNIANADALKRELELSGAIFHSESNSEVISHILTRERLKQPSIQQALEATMHKLRGAYSLVIMSPGKMMAARDPHGFRPLCMGLLGESVVFASESCALDSIGAAFVREIDPGEIVVVSKDGVQSIRTHCGKKNALCVFELIYFARPDSVVAGKSVHESRIKAGEILADEQPAEADVVIGVPDSGLDAALGYAKQSGIPYEVGFVKNRYIGRTFVQPTQAEREEGVRIKLNVIESSVKDKRVVLIDDSIVRGTTCGRIVRLIREAGAKEVHMRVCAPPFIHPCYFGTTIDSREDLIACKMSLDEIRKWIGADSLGYLSVDGAKELSCGENDDFCVGCFSGTYPEEPPVEKLEDKYKQQINKGKGIE